MPARAAAVVPGARLVYLVRDPIERIESHYLQRRLQDGARGEIADVLGDIEDPHNLFVARSRYATQLERWLAHFPQEQLLVLSAEELRDARHATVAAVLAHVGLDDTIDPALLDAEHHRSGDKAELGAGAARLRGSPAGRMLEAVPARVRAPVTRRLRAALSHPVARQELPADLRARLVGAAGARGRAAARADRPQLRGLVAVKVVVLCLDAVGPRMAGIAIRSVQIARALAPHADVVLAAARTSGEAKLDVPVVAYDRHDGRSVRAQLAGAEVVVCQPQWPLVMRELRDSGARLVFDLSCPEIIETLTFRAGGDPARRRLITAMTADRLVEALRIGHHFVASTSRQLDLWLGVAAGERLLTPAAYDRDPTLRSRFALAPHGVPEQPPQRSAGPGLHGTLGIEPSTPVVLWTSAIWSWLDAETPIRAMALLREQMPDAKLVFLGADPERAAGASAHAQAKALAGELGLLGDGVLFHEQWLTYDERADWLLDAACAVSCHDRHLETHFAFRTRYLDCFWAGLPLVVTEGDVLADRVAREGLGATVRRARSGWAGAGARKRDCARARGLRRAAGGGGRRVRVATRAGRAGGLRHGDRAAPGAARRGRAAAPRARCPRPRLPGGEGGAERRRRARLAARAGGLTTGARASRLRHNRAVVGERTRETLGWALAAIAAGAWAIFLVAQQSGAVTLAKPTTVTLAVPAVLLVALALVRRPLPRQILWAAGAILVLSLAFYLAQRIIPKPLLVFALPAAVAAGIACRKRPELALLALFAVASAFGVIDAFTPIPPSKLADLLLAGLWLGVAWRRLVGGEPFELRLIPGIVLLLAFAIITLAQVVAAPSFSFGIHTFISTGLYLITVVLVGASELDEQRLATIGKGIVAIALLAAAYAVLRDIIGPAGKERAIASLQPFNFKDGKLLLFGSFESRHQLGLWCALVVPFCAGMATVLRGRWRLAALAVIPLCAVAFISSESRAALVAALAGLARRARAAFDGPCVPGPAARRRPGGHRRARRRRRRRNRPLGRQRQRHHEEVHRRAASQRRPCLPGPRGEVGRSAARDPQAADGSRPRQRQPAPAAAGPLREHRLVQHRQLLPARRLRTGDRPRADLHRGPAGADGRARAPRRDHARPGAGGAGPRGRGRDGLLHRRALPQQRVRRLHGAGGMAAGGRRHRAVPRGAPRAGACAVGATR